MKRALRLDALDKTTRRVGHYFDSARCDGAVKAFAASVLKIIEGTLAKCATAVGASIDQGLYSDRTQANSVICGGLSPELKTLSPSGSRHYRSMGLMARQARYIEKGICCDSDPPTDGWLRPDIPELVGRCSVAVNGDSAG